MTGRHKVLIVDDIESIRIAIHDYLKNEYDVVMSSNGKEALKILQQQKIDIVISDIRMPDMDGITLIREIQNNFPGVKYSLITAYNINEYIRYAREYKIWNIIPKTSFLDLKFIKTMIYKLLTEDIFGFDKYFPDLNYRKLKLKDLYLIQKESGNILAGRTVYKILVHTEEERTKVCDIIYEMFLKHNAPSIVRLVLEEITINARDYGTDHFRNPIQIQFGIYDNNLLFGVNDYSGSLDFQEILERLERNVTLDYKGLPSSLLDNRGRGIFIARENLDHLIFNIQDGKETEVLGILDLENAFRTKALSMYRTKT